MERSQDSLVVINEFFDEGDYDEASKDTFEYCDNSLLSEDNCSLIILETGMAYCDLSYRLVNRFEEDDNAEEMSNMIPKFHSTPTTTPLLTPSTAIPLLLHSTSSTATILEESDSLIILEDEQVLPPTKRGRFESGATIENECCRCNCLSQFTNSEPLDCLHFFQSKTICDQNQFLISSFQLMSNTGSSHIQHVIKGKAVCKKGYMKMLKISEKRYQRNLKLFQSDPTVKFTRKSVSRRDSVKVSEAKAWMTRYFNRIGDSMPHMDQIHLPYGLTKRDVYYMMKGQLLDQGLDIVMSLSHFYMIWDTSFKNVVIPKVST